MTTPLTMTPDEERDLRDTIVGIGGTGRRVLAELDALRARLAEAEAAWRVPHFRGHPINPRDGENEIGSVIVTTAWYERLRALLAPERAA